jgi:tRNA(Glu) U13 pseudouridine synthase TruD
VGDGAVRLSFALPPGSYATVLVEELLSDLG